MLINYRVTHLAVTTEIRTIGRLVFAVVRNYKSQGLCDLLRNVDHTECN